MPETRATLGFTRSLTRATATGDDVPAYSVGKAGRGERSIDACARFSLFYIRRSGKSYPDLVCPIMLAGPG